MRKNQKVEGDIWAAGFKISIMLPRRARTKYIFRDHKNDRTVVIIDWTDPSRGYTVESSDSRISHEYNRKELYENVLDEMIVVAEAERQERLDNPKYF